MIKLLLLTALSLSSFSPLFASGLQGINNATSYIALLGDSSIKDQVLPESHTANGREGFKNLFVESSLTTNLSVKLNPLAISFVQGYVKSHTGLLTKMKHWGKPYFDMMDGVLGQYGLPAELKYLAVIESQLKSGAVSWAGAVGPWQFMPATARNMGLRIGKGRDERTDYTKSTHAAAKYLTNLYGIYNDWLLVIAAYNGGPGVVNNAIRRSGSRNFWELQRYLPAESRNHVKKFIATHYIMEGQGGLTTLTKGETDNYKLSQPVSVVTDTKYSIIQVGGKYNGQVIAQMLNMEPSLFNKLNPGFDRTLALGETYNMRLPADKLLEFQAQKPQILEQSIRLALTLAIQ
ncbi:MAG TPA: lytic transglycosylase domain-containing protein [Chitinophagaceae bacterium]|nr:lytic transglycosylase domain-containing protein [Chitinophagaceae bacterium]